MVDFKVGGTLIYGLSGYKSTGPQSREAAGLARPPSGPCELLEK
jgi:hypothetical protein